MILSESNGDKLDRIIKWGYFDLQITLSQDWSGGFEMD